MRNKKVKNSVGKFFFNPVMVLHYCRSHGCIFCMTYSTKSKCYILCSKE